MKTDGQWVGYGEGDTDPKVRELRNFMRKKFASYAGQLADSDVFDAELTAAVREMQNRYGLPVTGIINYQTQTRMGFINQPPPVKPIMFTVEGHLSDLWAGPVADTARQLEAEGHCRWQPIGYDCAALPFNNTSGILELARLVGATVLDNGTPFPPGTPWALAGFSQGGIVASYFYFNYLQPEQPLHWRAKDLVGGLMYGNPCRGEGRIAPWAQAWVKPGPTHGLDPYRRFDLPGFPATPDNWQEVFRGGDIFAENTNDGAGKVKAAVYQAVMGDFFSNPYSLAVEISKVFTVPIQEVLDIFMAIVSGIGFLATGPNNPHYSPYDIRGGVDWMRQQLTAAQAAA